MWLLHNRGGKNTAIGEVREIDHDRQKNIFTLCLMTFSNQIRKDFSRSDNYK
jgi:hypothetical protein